MSILPRGIQPVRKPLASGLMALALLAPPSAGAQEDTGKEAPAKDPETGFVMADGWKIVKSNCTACHSAKLVTQNHGTRERWAYLIHWMQDTQGLWQFPDDIEDTILDYLAKYHGPKDEYRRQPLPPEARPDNPYKQVTDASG